MVAFSRGHLTDQKVDPTFIQDFLCTFINPQLVHEADQCEWDSESQTLLTPSELADIFMSMDLEEQGWWKDVVVLVSMNPTINKANAPMLLSKHSLI